MTQIHERLEQIRNKCFDVTKRGPLANGYTLAKECLDIADGKEPVDPRQAVLLKETGLSGRRPYHETYQGEDTIA